ncbi:MAG: hypothetical protein H8D67_02705, partial [Deltaproteobacteria bacterium]|nr:hypothetical protein [Deltaproteobacteria bacterium]
LAQQFQLAGGGAFIQPVVKSEFGVEFPGSMPRLKLGYVTDCTGAPSLGPVPDLGPRDPLQPVGYQVNNLGIPGAKSFHLLVPGYALLNPYYFRFATDPNNMVIQEIPPLNSTFFALWLGSNDVLGYAISGGVGDTITGQATFGPAMGGIVQSLVGTGTKGVIANIPDIHDIPFFTTIPYNGMVLPSQDIVDQVNFAMGHFGLPYTYQLGPNPFLVADPTSSRPVYKVRQMKPGELVLLTVPQDSLCLGMGLISSITLTPWPLPDQFVLTQDEIKDEITNIETAIAGYNVIITGLAQTNGLALVDMNTKLKELESGLVWDGIHMNANFVTGGVFSLDGIHLNSRGNAIAANYFIESINAEYGSTIPFVDITKYQGVLFP